MLTNIFLFPTITSLGNGKKVLNRFGFSLYLFIQSKKGVYTALFHLNVIAPF
jgi:hypothetical protein